jgi:hypothetical protein
MGEGEFVAKSTADIERDIRNALTGCALEARGLWHEMRHLIEQYQRQDGGRPGHLQRNGKPLTDVQLSLAAGCTSDVVPRLLQELVDASLIERLSECWLSRPLAKLETTRRRHNEVEKASRSRRVSELVSSDTPSDTQSDTGSDADLTIRVPSPPVGSLPVPLSPIPPSPSLILPQGGKSGEPDEKPAKPGTSLPSPPPSLAQSPVFMASWRDWIQHRREIRKKMTPLAAQRQLDRLAKMGPDAAAKAIENSITHGWQGIFPDEDTQKRSNTNGTGSHAAKTNAFTGARRPLPVVRAAKTA